MSLLRRLFKVGQAEAHAALDHLEDPVKLAEQGIRDLRKDLQESMKGLAQVKSQAIRARGELSRQRDVATDFEQKAMRLVQKAERGEIEAGEADRLAGEALARRDQAISRGIETAKQVEHFEGMAGQLEGNIQNLKHQIAKWENELSTLKARSQVSKATKKLNQQLAQVDPSSTISMLEKMRDKVQEEEALAEAYGDMAMVEHSVDREIDQALAGSERPQSDSLAALKERMKLSGSGASPGARPALGAPED